MSEVKNQPINSVLGANVPLNVAFRQVMDTYAEVADINEDLLEDWGLEIPIFIDGPEDEGNFDDPGISDKNQYGVIVVCESAGTQESVFNDLTKMGFNCKIVVT
jgi:hypothetical protein